VVIGHFGIIFGGVTGWKLLKVDFAIVFISAIRRFLKSMSDQFVSESE
jgi:hypothetical protein